MDKPAFIQKDQVLPVSQNHRFLMEKGLQYVQEFSGKVWTDFNTHDPGVTILEQFCYGLTELGYKTSFPIEDLLIEGPNGKIDWEKNSFHHPSLVFSSHPVTENDFRKLLIDAFPEIQNCWLAPVYPAAREEGLNGLYQIEIIPSLSFQKRLRNHPSEASGFIKKVEDFLFENRNLGEDFTLPELLQPSQVIIHANVEVAQHQDVDAVMAQIIFSLEVHLYHPVAFSSLDELLKQGERIETIFSGPRLARGFIQDSELKSRSKSLHAEKMLQLVSKIPGVTKCWNLGFSKSGIEKTVLVPPHKYAAINTDFKDPDSVFSSIRIFVNGNIQLINKPRVTDLLLDLWSKNYRIYQVDLFKESFWNKKIKGKFRNPGKYNSIQHHFPALYGLGNNGLSSHEPLERHGKVRQLKGYLMLMEKHLANFLAQLSHTSDFFDFDVSDETGTYFSQDFETLVGKDELEIKNKLNPGFNQFGENPQTGETRLNWLKRKNRILDHLLARFGEQLPELPFQLSLKLNLIGTEEEMYASMLLQKSKFLRLIPNLNYHKNRASFRFTDSEESVPVLIKLLCLSLGISEKTKSLVTSGFSILDSEEVSSFSSGSIKSKNSNKDFFDAFRPLSKQERIFSKSGTTADPSFSFGKMGIKSLFSRTLNTDFYWISRSTDDNNRIEVLFQKSETSFVRVWEGNSLGSALSVIGKNIEFFRNENSLAEGMYLVDHILLRSIVEDSLYGFEIRDEWGNPTFVSEWYTLSSERSASLNSFYEAAIDSKSYFIQSDRIQIRGKKGELLASFKNLRGLDLHKVMEDTAEMAYMMAGEYSVSGRLALAEIEKLRLKGTLHKDGIYRQRSLGFLRKLKNGKIVNEDFFDLKASLLLPDWPARFQEKHFRHFLENEAKERVPAHLGISIYWLNLQEFITFEKIYLDWLNSAHEKKPGTDRYNSALNLYDYLFHLKHGGGRA